MTCTHTSGAHWASATSPLSSVATMEASPDDAGTTSLGGPTPRNARPSTRHSRQENMELLPWAMAARASKRLDMASGAIAAEKAGTHGSLEVQSIGGSAGTAGTAKFLSAARTEAPEEWTDEREYPAWGKQSRKKVEFFYF